MKINQKGRSMVEMLGVLAIIGVLSAAGLKGYSNAMFKYKMNKTIDIYSQILQRFAELDEKGLGERIEIGNAQDFVKYGFLDKCQQDEDESCRLPIGKIRMDFMDGHLGESIISGEFYVSFTSSKECVAFASAHWENAVPVDWWNPWGFIGIFEPSPETVLYDPNGYMEEVINEMTMDMVTQGCRSCDQEGGCVLYHVIRSEL